MRRVLITGGAGFIGSHLCKFFLDQGDEVFCIDNFLTGRRENIQQWLKHPKFTFWNRDVTEFIGARHMDMVLHFASPASPTDFERLPIQILKVGSLGTLNALGIAKKYNARFLLASTSECYGDPQVSPQSEDYWGNVNPIGVRGVYDESKRFAEAMTMAYHRHHGLDTRIIRIFNTYGDNMRLDDGRAIPTFFRQALKDEPITVHGDGNQTRSVMHVDDLITGIDALLHSGVHTPVNIGNPKPCTINHLAEEIKRMTCSKSEIVHVGAAPDDPKTRMPDIRLAKRVLGWEPVIGMTWGLRRVMEYFKKEVERDDLRV
jgi:dTDP-glucose 4,6-dehydratase